MNVMAQAHKATKAKIARKMLNGHKPSYKAIFALELKAAHKVNKKFIIDGVDIRNLPEYSAANGVTSLLNVDHWSIKGNMQGDEFYNERVSGFHISTLERNLNYWACQQEYTALFLILEINDVLYKLTK